MTESCTFLGYKMCPPQICFFNSHHPRPRPAPSTPPPPLYAPQQDTCVSASDGSLRGTCMTSQECKERMGQPDGVCAAGGWGGGKKKRGRMSQSRNCSTNNKSKLQFFGCEMRHLATLDDKSGGKEKLSGSSAELFFFRLRRVLPLLPGLRRIQDGEAGEVRCRNILRAFIFPFFFSLSLPPPSRLQPPPELHLHQGE